MGNGLTLEHVSCAKQLTINEALAQRTEARFEKLACRR